MMFIKNIEYMFATISLLGSLAKDFVQLVFFLEITV